MTIVAPTQPKPAEPEKAPRPPTNQPPRVPPSMPPGRQPGMPPPGAPDKPPPSPAVLRERPVPGTDAGERGRGEAERDTNVNTTRV